MKNLNLHLLFISAALIGNIEYSMCAPVVLKNTQSQSDLALAVDVNVDQRAKEIIARAAQIYANARTLSCQVYENKSRDGRDVRARYEVQWKRPNLAAVKRFETDVETQRTNFRNVIIDGKTIHQLLDNEYSSRVLPPLRGFGVLVPTGVFSLSLLGSQGFVEMLGTPQMPIVKYLGAGRVGKIEVENVQVKIANGAETVEYRFAIDKTRHLLQQASMRFDTGIGVMTTTETYANVRLNAPIDARVFRFAPTPQMKAQQKLRELLNSDDEEKS